MKIRFFTYIIAIYLLSAGFLSAQNKAVSKKTSKNESFDIVYQRCEWTVDPAIADLSGTITYYFKTTHDDFQEIILHLADNMIVDAVTQRSAELLFDHSDKLVKISLPTPLALNVVDSFSIAYHGVPGNSGLGSYVRAKHQGIPITWTLSCPYGAEDWFPCKNDLQDKADSMDIFITVPEGNRAAANGKLVSVRATENGQNVFHWKHRYPIVTYLVAFAVTNYEAYSDWLVRSETDSLEILNYVYPESLANAQVQTPSVKTSLSIYEELFGRYPFSEEKYGHAQFGWGGGMEHQTMSFMVSFSFDLIAHELAHQWFGDMITCGSWHDIWLNEGLATYCTALTLEREFPVKWENWKTQTRSSVTGSKSGSVYCYDITNVNRIFNQRLTYDKGGFVLHTLRWIIGDEAFFQGMWNYANDPELQYGFAFTPDFQRHMEEASGKNLTDFFDTWIYKEGFPYYDVNILQSEDYNTTVTIEQTPSHASVECFNLPIPVQFIGDEQNVTFVFDNNQLNQTFECNPGFKVKKVVVDPQKWLLCVPKTQFVGIDEADEDASLVHVFPNPAKDFFTVQYMLSEKSRWTLFDLSGKKIKVGEAQPNSQFIIKTNGLSTGLYLLYFQVDKKEFTKKMFVTNSK